MFLQKCMQFHFLSFHQHLSNALLHFSIREKKHIKIFKFGPNDDFAAFKTCTTCIHHQIIFDGLIVGDIFNSKQKEISV